MNKPREVARVVAGQAVSDGAGVRLTRLVGTPGLDHFDPFLLLDEFRSDTPGDYLAGFPEHPHRGFETVTYMLAGRMRHRDNQGNEGLLTAGSIQWMTAGKGIVHSEMPEQEDGLMWGFQLWVNLPAQDKMQLPRYQDIPPSDVPVVSVGGGHNIKVLAGEFAERRGPVRDVAVDPLYLDISLAAGAEALQIDVSDTHNAMFYVIEGNLKLGKKGTALQRGQLALLGAGDQLLMACDQPARGLLIAGVAIGEPIARHGPFVMNTREELQEAFEDFQAGRF